MIIYKDDLIEAVALEPLGFGEWASAWDAYGISAAKNNSTCKVCAVGATFRAFTNKAAWVINSCAGKQFSDKYLNAMEEYVAGNWLTAISNVWEGLFDNNPTLDIPEARGIMLDWIEDNVPEDTELWRV